MMISKHINILAIGLICNVGIISTSCAQKEAVQSDDMVKYGLKYPAKSINVENPKFEFAYKVIFYKNCKASSINHVNPDGSFRSVTNNKYDNDDRLVESLNYNADNELEARFTYVYEGDFVKESKIYGMNNDELHRWENENDGNHIISSRYFAENEFSHITTWTYKGEYKLETSTDANNEVLGTAEFIVLEDERPVRIIHNQDTVEIKYSEDKLLPVWSRNIYIDTAGELSYNPEIEVNKEIYYSYEYDKKGNWIKRHERYGDEDKAHHTTIRKIRYR